MQHAIKLEIKRLAGRALEKRTQAEKLRQTHRKRFEKRTGLKAVLPRKTPAAAPRDRHFDPVYCARNANFLARTLWHKVLERTYAPEPAVCYRIKKPSGGYREVMAFSIPDAALANVVFRRTRDRNIKRFSPFSYAYHPGRSVLDAVLTIREHDFEEKTFVVQIDFKKYFDSIPSRYLKEKLADSERIRVTPQERYVFEQFLRHAYYDGTAGNGTPLLKRRHKGTPQGSSVSLFLANLANHDLDASLTRAGGSFVRFADDVVALCTTYAQAQAIERCFLEHCRRSGLTLNVEKSPGIAILSEHDREMKTISHFDYLGFRFTPGGMTIPEKSVSKLKSKISRLINLYLLHYLKAGFNPDRCGLRPFVYDWDLLGLICELRRALYGGLAEEQITDFLQKNVRLPRMKGLMSFYCLLDDPKPFRALDGWMLSMVRRAMKTRNRLLLNKYQHECPQPSNRELATGLWLDSRAWRGSGCPCARMPSFVRGWRAARKHLHTFGLEDVADLPSSSSFDNAELFDMPYAF